ncbi:MAG: hypothetical protein HWE15_15180 [Algoriphagus sp.]|uniref:hypothetical protein n=1 Tax=Algoriphagus sp. TaxID=1872435 RepID=UPI00179B9F90|nr:hypothetical protein [Algoriphagus sp.]NVJ87644.1 hypothetical protein [Algoriphagus sp.]
MRKIIFAWGLCTLLVASAWSQTVNENLANLEKYQEELPFFQELITGAQYPEPPRNYDGFPYFSTRSFEKGGLTINRVFYPDVPLLYDIRYDQVITFHPLFSQKLLINPAKIDGFVLEDGSEFRQLSGNEDYLYDKNGFYEIIASGSMELVSKHYKVDKPARELGDYVGYYIEYEDFFLVKGDQFFPVKRKKDAIKLLQVEKKGIRENLTRNRIYFNQNRRNYLKALLQLATQSETL